MSRAGCATAPPISSCQTPRSFSSQTGTDAAMKYDGKPAPASFAPEGATFMAVWRKSARSILSLKRSEAARRPAALFGPFESQPASASAVKAPAPLMRLAPRNARRSMPSLSAAWRGSQSLLMTSSS